MNVEDLMEKLSRLDPTTNICIIRDNEGDPEFFDITDVALSKGTPQRSQDTGKAGFKFDGDRGAGVDWAFLTIDEA